MSSRVSGIYNYRYSAAARVAALARASNSAVDLLVNNGVRAGIRSHINALSTRKTHESKALLAKLRDEDSRESMDLLQRVRNDFLNREMKERIREGFGRKKADLAYDYMYKRLVTVNRRFVLGLALCKIAHHSEASGVVSHLSSADFVAFMDLLDNMCNLSEGAEKKAAEHQQLRESAFAASKATLPEKILKRFLPDASQGDMASAMMTFIKEKMNLSGKENQHTDDICMDLLLASPFNNLLMFFAASVTGSLGIMVVMLPFYLLWTGVSAAKSVMTPRSDLGDVTNPTRASQFTKLLTDSDSSFLLTRRTEYNSAEKLGFADKEEHKKSWGSKSPNER